MQSMFRIGWILLGIQCLAIKSELGPSDSYKVLLSSDVDEDADANSSIATGPQVLFDKLCQIVKPQFHVHASFVDES